LSKEEDLEEDGGGEEGREGGREGGRDGVGGGREGGVGGGDGGGEEMGLRETYVRMYRVARLPAVVSLVGMLMTSKIAFAAADSVTSLKLQVTISNCTCYH
jgi:hypothetical protein